MPDPITTTTTTASGNASSSPMGVVTIQQGPEWLAGLLLQPPLWFQALYYVFGVAFLGWAVYRLAEHDWDVPLEVQGQMLWLSGIVVMTILGTMLVMHRYAWSYLWDVSAGVVIGQVSVFVGRGLSVGPRRVGYSRRQMLVVGWFWVGVLAIFGPLVVPVDFTGITLSASRHTVGVLAFAMTAYNYHRLSFTKRDSDSVKETGQ